MPSTRELRGRIRSVRNLAQVTKALETVSASRVRHAIQANEATRPYAEKAWKVLIHLARQPGYTGLHPLLTERPAIRRALVLMIAGDRGLAGAYNVNILRHTLAFANQLRCPVRYVAVGRKGRDLLIRQKRDVAAVFGDLPSPPSFQDVAAIGRLVVDDFEVEACDEVYITYTYFKNMLQQEPRTLKLLPLTARPKEDAPPDDLSATGHSQSVFIYEPDQNELLGQIIPRFTGLQIFRAILSSHASEHAARMLAMHNATESAQELIDSLQLEYNKQRQNVITNEMLDIAGGANALSQTERRGQA